ncbi:MAG: WbqC family protein [Prevotella sp.]|nr:WbqC family protein [Prevotella sp.]MCM1075588.1 WbqC family protein [Ruminococcus sp.]
MKASALPYLASVGWYGSLLESGTVPPGSPDFRNTTIRGAWGEQTLTVPILGGRKRLGRVPYDALQLSEHDDWRHKHWQAITSAYGALPYFPYFKDEFAPIFLNGPIEKLAELNRILHQAFLKCSGIAELRKWLAQNPGATYPRRECDVPKHICALELLFKYGPETIFYL